MPEVCFLAAVLLLYASPAEADFGKASRLDASQCVAVMQGLPTLSEAPPKPPPPNLCFLAALMSACASHARGGHSHFSTECWEEKILLREGVGVGLSVSFKMFTQIKQNKIDLMK